MINYITTNFQCFVGQDDSKKVCFLAIILYSCVTIVLFFMLYNHVRTCTINIVIHIGFMVLYLCCLSHTGQPERGCITMINIILSLTTSIIASIIAYYICKWLDSKL